jgi:hypothetical protein
LASGAVQGVAAASGAGPIGTMSPTTAADATDTETIRRIADNVTPFQGQTSHRRPQWAYVTIVFSGTVVIGDALIGMHP